MKILIIFFFLSIISCNNEIKTEVKKTVTNEIKTIITEKSTTTNENYIKDIKGFYNGMTITEALNLMNGDNKDIFQYFCEGECVIQKNENKSSKIIDVVFSEDGKKVSKILFTKKILEALFDKENINSYDFITFFMKEYNISKNFLTISKEKRKFLVISEIAEEICDIYKISLDNMIIQFTIIKSINNIEMEIIFIN